MIQALKKIILFLFLTLWTMIMPSAVLSGQGSLLQEHSSPYLSMHADDPVQWQLWGREALATAQNENKLIFLSIGYFSCHWCHVMQRESYQNAQIAAYLNRHFVPVKVDRELRPELDRRLLRFVEQLRGQAGWPLNVFITPEGYPVTGFTYLPKDDFLKVIIELNSQWQQRHARIKEIAIEYFEQTASIDDTESLPGLKQEDIGKLLQVYISQAMAHADELQGGFGDSIKFPSYPQLNSLLRMIRLHPSTDRAAIDFMQLTLDSMASFNLMDHLNGGFFRYSTDPDWQTPHFEKMLYDNAQLAALYLDAESLWADRGYAEIGLRTIDFMLEFLSDTAGGFNASLSAVDENGVEGAGYLWTQQELRSVLTESEFNHLRKAWSLREGVNDNFQSGPLIGIGSNHASAALNRRILDKLSHVKKPLMPVDNKRLASWNALVLTALVKAMDFDQESRMEGLADKQFDYIQNNFINYSAERGIGVVRFAGQPLSAETTLEDYAQLAHAIQGYALKKRDKKAGQIAQDLAQASFNLFFREGRWVQDAQSLIPGDRGDAVIQDAVLQSPSSLLLESILMMPEPAAELLSKAESLIPRLTRDLLEGPFYYGSSILLNELSRRAADGGSTQ